MIVFAGIWGARGRLKATRYALTPLAISSSSAPSAGAAGQTLTLTDGSTAIPLNPGSVLRLDALAADHVVVAVERGGGRFVVTPNTSRVFRVEAGPVAVEVGGANFSVERRVSSERPATEAVQVTVESGRARVIRKGAAVMLSAGATQSF